MQKLNFPPPPTPRGVLIHTHTHICKYCIILHYDVSEWRYVKFLNFIVEKDLRLYVSISVHVSGILTLSAEACMSFSFAISASACMYVCMYVCMYICTYIDIHRLHPRGGSYLTHTFGHIHTDIHAHTCTRVQISFKRTFLSDTHTHTHTHAYIYTPCAFLRSTQTHNFFQSNTYFTHHVCMNLSMYIPCALFRFSFSASASLNR
jgi:hypothetical protein